MASEAAPGVPRTSIVDYFSAKLREHGATALGVDWNSETSQLLRFRKMAEVIGPNRPVSITDLGCGYGAFLDYLDAAGIDCGYVGIDASADMVAAARARLAGRANASFEEGTRCTQVADYTLAIGIFSLRLDVDDAAWFAYIRSTLDDMNRHTRRAFAFNCLTMYSDPERMRPDLYYADPCQLFDHCKRHYAKDVALWHDYGAWEFTIVVRKMLD